MYHALALSTCSDWKNIAHKDVCPFFGRGRQGTNQFNTRLCAHNVTKVSRGYEIKSLNIDNIYNDPYYRSTTPLPHHLPLTPPSHNPNIKPPHPTRDRKTQTSQHQRKKHNTIKRPRIRLSQSYQLVGRRC